MTEEYQRLVILREERDYGSLELQLGKGLFRLYHVPVFDYNFCDVRDIHRPSQSCVLLFSSRAGVRATAPLLRQMDNKHCIVIGEDTQNALRAADFDGKIEKFLTIRSFLDHLSHTKRKDIKSIHYYRGDVIKMPDFSKHIVALGLKFSEQIVYKTTLLKVIPDPIKTMVQEARHPIGYVALSQRGMSHWDDLVFYHCLVTPYRKGHLFCLSKDVASGSRIMPQSQMTVTSEPTTTSLIQSIESFYKRFS